jgi:REP element-mobilizing transposase RayT
VLEQVRRRYRFVVVGYVVMPEHVHLLISEPERGIHRVLVDEVQKATLQVRPRAVVPTLRKPRRVGNLLVVMQRVGQRSAIFEGQGAMYSSPRSDFHL